MPVDYGDNGDNSGYQPSDPTMHPALAAFRQAFTAPGSQAWADEMTTRLNDYVQRRHMALENIRAGDNFVSDLDQFKQGLTDFVHTDPHAIHTALDMVAPTIHHLVGSMPGAPEDTSAHRSALIGHMESELATAAITSAARRDKGTALGLLNDPRLSSILDDGAKGALGTFIDTLDRARTIDRTAQQRTQAQQQQVTADAKFHSYLASLVDPETDQIGGPPGWNQRMIEDPDLTPGHKVAAGTLYNHLLSRGDAVSSDPFLMSRIVANIAQGSPPSMAEVISHAGGALTLPDALHLSTYTQPLPPDAKARVNAMHGVLKQAQDLLIGPDGENGAAGASAYGRFMNWFMPQARRGAALNPDSDNYLFGQGAIHSFMPTGDDLPKAVPASRPSLSDIFAGVGNAFAGVARKGLANYNEALTGQLESEPMGNLRTISTLVGGSSGNLGAGVLRDELGGGQGPLHGPKGETVDPEKMA